MKQYYVVFCSRRLFLLYYICRMTGFAQAGVLSGSQNFIFPGSNTKNITLLNSSSNIGVQGVWLFRLHDFSPEGTYVCI